MRRNSLGEGWWVTKGLIRSEEKEDEENKKQKELMNKEKSEAKAAMMANEDLVKRRMGVLYYLTFWDRSRVRRQVNRIAAINADLEAKEAEDENKGEE